MTEVLHAASRVVRVTSVACLALGFSMGASELANAQTGALTPGSWVRLATDGGKLHLVGRVVSVTPDSITIQHAEPWMSDRQINQHETIALPIGTVSGVEVRTGGSSHAFEGLVLGTASGAAAGGALGYLAANSRRDKAQDFVSTAGVLAGLGAIVGGVLGISLGASTGTSAWTPVETKKVSRLEIAPRGNGVSARLSFSFR